MPSAARKPCRSALALVATALLLASCGGGDPSPRPPPAAGPSAPSAPRLLTEPPGDGEIVVDGEASPASHGPFDLDGRYRVRFAQYAPEDPRADFAAQVPFVAELVPARPGPRSRPLRLFKAAERSGRRTIDVHGSYTVDVVFGDFPYVVRLTPLGR